jgi:hypothetical protein
MYEIGTAPTFVFECEWSDEVSESKKGIDKILNYYFATNCVGVPAKGSVTPTSVREAWMLVIPETPIMTDEKLLKTPPLRWRVRNVPFIGFLLYFCLSLVFHCLNGFLAEFLQLPWIKAAKIERILRKPAFAAWFRWIYICIYDVVEASDYPPANPVGLPYLVVYFRNRPHSPLYYHLRPNSIFLPPCESIFGYGPPLPTNLILKDCE